jgi:hypothetical protein
MTTDRWVEVLLAADAVLAVAEPVQLIGTGFSLAGELVVVGEGPRSIRLNPWLVWSEEGEEIALPARPVTFRPGRQRSVPVAIDISPPLGPGTRHAQLRLGEFAIPAEVLVAESRSLTVLPNPIAVPNEPGVAATVDVVCRNNGNVPAFVGSIGPVQVTGGRRPRLFGPAGERDRDEDERPVFLEIDVLSDQEWVQPGRTETLRWTVTVPDGLPAGALHGGSAPLSSTPVSFLVIPPSSALRRERAGSRPGPGGQASGRPRRRASSPAARRPARAKEPPSG